MSHRIWSASARRSPARFKTSSTRCFLGAVASFAGGAISRRRSCERLLRGFSALYARAGAGVGERVHRPGCAHRPAGANDCERGHENPWPGHLRRASEDGGVPAAPRTRRRAGRGARNWDAGPYRSERSAAFIFFSPGGFALETPYLSRDDRVFSVTENPVRKDWVFGLPLIAATTWKGALRNACLIEAREAVDRLFGPEPPKNSQGDEPAAALHEGRICTFTSFFTQIATEIVNPHDRVRRIGKNPIRIECVPRGARSRLALLYLALPRDERSRSLTLPDFRKQVAGDLIAVARCVRGAMRDYGVSAKKSSGYGAATDALVGERGIIEVAGLDGGPASFAKFSELIERAEALAARIQGSA